MKCTNRELVWSGDEGSILKGRMGQVETGSVLGCSWMKVGVRRLVSGLHVFVLWIFNRDVENLWIVNSLNVLFGLALVRITVLKSISSLT